MQVGAREDDAGTRIQMISVGTEFGKTQKSTVIVIVEGQGQGKLPMSGRRAQVVAVRVEEPAGFSVVTGDLKPSKREAV